MPESGSTPVSTSTPESMSAPLSLGGTPVSWRDVVFFEQATSNSASTIRFMTSLRQPCARAREQGVDAEYQIALLLQHHLVGADAGAGVEVEVRVLRTLHEDRIVHLHAAAEELAGERRHRPDDAVGSVDRDRSEDARLAASIGHQLGEIVVAGDVEPGQHGDLVRRCETFSSELSLLAEDPLEGVAAVAEEGLVSRAGTQRVPQAVVERLR